MCQNPARFIQAFRYSISLRETDTPAAEILVEGVVEMAEASGRILAETTSAGAAGGQPVVARSTTTTIYTRRPRRITQTKCTRLQELSGRRYRQRGLGGREGDEILVSADRHRAPGYCGGSDRQWRAFGGGDTT